MPGAKEFQCISVEYIANSDLCELHKIRQDKIEEHVNWK